MCAHIAITVTAHHTRCGQQHKGAAEAGFLIGLRNSEKSEVADFVNGMAAQRCEAPLIKPDSSDSLQATIQ